MNKKTNNCYFIIASIVSSVLAGVIVFLTIFFNIKKKPDEEKKADNDVLKKEIETLKKEHDQLLTQIPKDADWQIYVDDFYDEQAQKIFQQQKEKIKKEIKDLNVTCNQSDLKAQKQCLLDCNQKVKQTINNFNNFNNTYQQDLIDFKKNLEHEENNFQNNSKQLKTKQQEFFNDQQDDSFYSISDYQNDYLVQKQEFDHQKEEINTNISTLTNDFSKCQNNKTKLQQYTCYQQLNSNVTKVQETLEKLKINFTQDFETAKSKNNQKKKELDDFQKLFHDFQANNFLTFIKAVIPDIALAIPEKFDTSCSQHKTLQEKYNCLRHLLAELRENMITIKTNYAHYFLDYLRHIILFPISLYAFDNNKTFSQFQDVKNATISYLNNYFNTTVKNISDVDFIVDIKNLLIKIKKVNQQQYEEFLNAIDPFNQEQKLPGLKLFQNFSNVLNQTANVSKIIFDYQNLTGKIDIAISSDLKNEITFYNLRNKFNLTNNLIANLVACEKRKYCHDNYLGYYQSLLLKNFIIQYYNSYKEEHRQVQVDDQYYQNQLKQLNSVPTNIKDHFIYVNDFNNRIKELLEKLLNQSSNIQQIKDKINNIENVYNFYQIIEDLDFKNKISNQINQIIRGKLYSFPCYNNKIFYNHNSYSVIFDIFKVLKFNECYKNFYSHFNIDINFFNETIENLRCLKKDNKVLTYSTDIERFVLETLKNGKSGVTYESNQSLVILVSVFLVNLRIFLFCNSEYKKVIKLQDNKKIYSFSNLMIIIFNIGIYCYSFYSLFFNYQYDFSDLNLDELYCQNYSKKEDGTKVCNSYVLIYEGIKNNNYKYFNLSRKIGAQENLFMNKQSSAAKIRFWSLSSSALLLIIYYYFLSCQEYIKTQRIYKGGAVRHPWYVRFFQFIFRLKINNNLNG